MREVARAQMHDRRTSSARTLRRYSQNWYARFLEPIGGLLHLGGHLRPRCHFHAYRGIPKVPRFRKATEERGEASEERLCGGHRERHSDLFRPFPKTALGRVPCGHTAYGLVVPLALCEDDRAPLASAEEATTH